MALGNRPVAHCADARDTRAACDGWSILQPGFVSVMQAAPAVEPVMLASLYVLTKRHSATADTAVEAARHIAALGASCLSSEPALAAAQMDALLRTGASHTQQRA